MVKKKPSLYLRSTMPVKDNLKVQSNPQGGVDNLSISDDKDSDELTSRALRNRFVISNEKRSIRFRNDVGHLSRRGGEIRSCRLTASSHQHFTLSQTEDDDEDIFTPRSPSRKSRLRHMLQPRRVTTRSRPSVSVNGHSTTDKEDSQGVEGIRRSKRQRKLKYENYSDSWIVGAQTLRGYPMYGNSYSKKDSELKEEMEEEDIEKGVGEEEVSDAESDGVDKEPAEAGVEGGAEGVAGESGMAEKPTAGFEDMYTRVKRTRRVTLRYQEALANQRQTRASNRHHEANSSDADSSSEEEVNERKYHLRKTKPVVDRFQAQIEPVRKRVIRAVLYNTVHRHRRRSCSSSSDSSEAERFPNNKSRQAGVASNKAFRCLPQGWANKDRKADAAAAGSRTGRLADVDPITLDTSIRFQQVGGLEQHIRCLQEMVVFPMLYADVFRKFHVTPPKGVLFHGPPGTGKTLIARALANECSKGERKVAFFMRKGADCLSKWVGESERQLRLLFEEAYQARPSIIFFDELDGLAPVRSAKQDQIHASIVSTLLALMDGLDSRGDVIVIGATNRVDAIDPALRRPGRFDRELHFPLPANKEREEILRIHMSQWSEPPPPTMLAQLSETVTGYCGSDLRALCTEAVIQALRRRYPQIYNSSQRLLLDPENVKVERCDFEAARRTIVPASHRSAHVVGRRLAEFVEPLLGPPLSSLLSHIKLAFPAGFTKSSTRMVKSPRLLIVGQKKQTTFLAAALIYKLEQCPVHTLDLATLYSESARTPEEATVQVFNELRRSVPSILYLPGVVEWWETVGNTVRVLFTSLLAQVDPSLPILLLATAKSPTLPSELRHLFSRYRNEVYTVNMPSAKQRSEFFSPLFLVRAVKPPVATKSHASQLEELPVAPPPSPPKMTDTQLKVIYDKEENTLRELRIFLRQICAKLARNRQFFMFSKPVDIKEVPDYLQIIRQPMDLETMMSKIDLHRYTCAQDFLNDIDLLCCNALEYNPDRAPADKLIRHRACFLRDTAYALIKAEMDSDFEESCRDIRSARAKRAVTPDRFAPDFVRTAATPLPYTGLSSYCSRTDGSNHGVSSDGVYMNGVSSNGSGNGGTSSRTGIDSITDLKKKRRRNNWSRGFVNVRKRVKLKAKSSSPVNASGEHKTETVVSTSKKEPETLPPALNLLPPNCHSTPIVSANKRKRSSQLEASDKKVENGTESLSSDDELGEKEEEDENCDSIEKAKIKKLKPNSVPTASNRSRVGGSKTVVVNVPALERLLKETVAATGRLTSFESLIDLYAQLRSVVHRYSKMWNRDLLPEDLERELKRFLKTMEEEEEELNSHSDTLNTTL